MKRVAIIGAAGAVGTYMAEMLSETEDVALFGISRRTEFPQRKLYDTFCGADLTIASPMALGYHLKDFNPEIIFNFASIANVSESFKSIPEFINNNINATVNLLEAIRLSGICPKFIQASSSEVYGTPNYWPIDESHPQQPANPYAISKTTQDNLVQYYHKVHDLDAVIARCFSYINPRRADLAATAFAAQLKTGHIRHGNLESVRTFCDVRDIVEAYWLCTECDAGSIYNIGATEPVTIGEILKRLISLSGELVVCEQTSSRPADVTYQIPNVDRFRRDTSWEPQISLDDSLRWLLSEVH
jgi:GDP-4-dehydro-6-deoxy-D-mannose reductase